MSQQTVWNKDSSRFCHRIVIGTIIKRTNYAPVFGWAPSKTFNTTALHNSFSDSGFLPRKYICIIICIFTCLLQPFLWWMAFFLPSFYHFKQLWPSRTEQNISYIAYRTSECSKWLDDRVFMSTFFSLHLLLCVCLLFFFHSPMALQFNQSGTQILGNAFLPLQLMSVISLSIRSQPRMQCPGKSTSNTARQLEVWYSTQTCIHWQFSVEQYTIFTWLTQLMIGVTVLLPQGGSSPSSASLMSSWWQGPQPSAAGGSACGWVMVVVVRWGTCITSFIWSVSVWPHTFVNNTNSDMLQ